MTIRFPFVSISSLSRMVSMPCYKILSDSLTCHMKLCLPFLPACSAAAAGLITGPGALQDADLRLSGRGRDARCGGSLACARCAGPTGAVRLLAFQSGFSMSPLHRGVATVHRSRWPPPCACNRSWFAWRAGNCGRVKVSEKRLTAQKRAALCRPFCGLSHRLRTPSS